MEVYGLFVTVINTSSVLKYLQHFWHACRVYFFWIFRSMKDEGDAEDSGTDTEIIDLAACQ